MSDISQLDRIIEYCRSNMIDTDMHLSGCGTRLSIVWPKKNRRYAKSVASTSSIVTVVAASVFVVSAVSGSNGVGFAFGFIFALMGFFIALFSFLFYLSMADTIIDFKGKYIQHGKFRTPFSKVIRVGVRRNLHNERLRVGVVEHVSDEDLASISVDLHISELRRHNFGLFTSTAIAVQFARELARMMRIKDDIVVNGTRKWPGVCYREKKLLGSPLNSLIVTNELLSTLLYSLDPPENYCVQLDLEDEFGPVFRTAIVWKGDRFSQYKGSDFYFPSSIVFFDEDPPYSREGYYFVAQIDGQLDVREVQGVSWSCWLDNHDKSEPCLETPGLLAKIENSFLAMVRETEKLGITLKDSCPKRYIPLQYVDAWVTLAELCDWSFDDCENLRNYLSTVTNESVDPFSVSMLVDGYCNEHNSINLLFMYFDGIPNLVDILEKVEAALSGRLDAVVDLVKQYFYEECSVDIDRFFNNFEYFLHQHQYHITKVIIGGDQSLYFVHLKRNSKPLNRALDACFSS